MTYLEKKIGNRFSIRYTSEDAQIAIPMMVVSILMLAVVVCL